MQFFVRLEHIRKCFTQREGIFVLEEFSESHFDSWSFIFKYLCWDIQFHFPYCMFWYVFFDSEKTATFSSDPKTRKIVQRKYKSAMVKEFSYFEFFFWPGWSWPSLIFEAMMKSSFWYLDKGSVGRVKRQKLQDFYHLGPRGGGSLVKFFLFEYIHKNIGTAKTLVWVLWPPDYENNWDWFSKRLQWNQNFKIMGPYGK